MPDMPEGPIIAAKSPFSVGMSIPSGALIILSPSDNLYALCSVL